MAKTYRITAPDGKVYRVTGDGTKEEALAEFQAQWDAKQGPKIKTAADQPEQSWGDWAAQRGRDTREAITDRPLQTLDDVARGAANLVTLGGADRFAAFMNKNYLGDENASYELEKARSEAADSRAGTWDDAFNLAIATRAPALEAPVVIQGAKTLVPRAVNAGARALGYGAEGAGLAGVQAVIQGEDPLPAMAYGGVGGAAGSIGSDVVGSVANVFSRKAKPQFGSDEELEAAAKLKKARKGKQYGSDVVVRDDLVREINTAAAKGKQGFRDLDTTLRGYGTDPAIPRKVYDEITRLGNMPNKGSVLRRGAANLLDFGGGWGKLASTKISGGAFPAMAAGLRTIDDFSGEITPKQLGRLKTMLLQGAHSGKNPNMTDEMKNTLRHYLTRMTSTAVRDNQE